MTGQPLFLVAEDGTLGRMESTPVPSETALQELIERYPEVVGHDDMRLLLVKRELPISDSEGSGGRWSVDHLFVADDAVPVLVEVKRAPDTRLRREVVGQMLDYAANGIAYWPAGTVATTFANTCSEAGKDPDLVLRDFLRPDEDFDGFWEQVDANFRAGNIRLLFVADVIPTELGRIVEFLNEQMRADVRALELRYYEGANGVRTLAPRLIGATERAKAGKVRAAGGRCTMSAGEWIETRLKPHGEAVLRDARAVAEAASRIGLALRPTQTGDSVGLWTRRREKGRACIGAIGSNGRLSLYFGYLPHRIDMEQRRAVGDKFIERFGPLSNDRLADGHPSCGLGARAADTEPPIELLLAEWANLFSFR